MKICPTCHRDAEYLVHNVQDGSVFSPACAPPTFNPHGILTLEDLKFMEGCGIDPQPRDVLHRLVTNGMGLTREATRRTNLDGLVFLMCLLMVLAGNSHLHYRPASALLGLTYGSVILLVGVSVRIALRRDLPDITFGESTGIKKWIRSNTFGKS